MQDARLLSSIVLRGSCAGRNPALTIPERGAQPDPSRSVSGTALEALATERTAPKENSPSLRTTAAIRGFAASLSHRATFERASGCRCLRLTVEHGIRPR